MKEREAEEGKGKEKEKKQEVKEKGDSQQTSSARRFPAWRFPA